MHVANTKVIKFRPPLFSDQNRKILEDCYNGIVQPGAAPPSVATLRLHINGVQFDVNNPDPHTSLNEFIRNQQGFKGTKVMCNEGGCGCCVVALTRIDPLTGREITLSVNSCLFPLYAANGCEVTTAEGIGNRKNGFHTIQKRVAEHNGSQCGFCTPGMVMTMYSLLKENPKPTKQQIEDSFDGNICRCTGYRPILDAMKTFAADAQPIDIEELSKCVGKCDDCKCKRQRTVPENTSGVEWYAPTSLAQLYAILEKHRENNVKLIAGNTGKGVYKDEGPFQAMVDINAVQELHCSTEVSSHLLVGSSVSLNSFINLCESKSSKSSSFGAFARHLRVVANTHVRNVGSLGGNLMLAHAHKDFPSDLMTIFEATGASLLIGGPLLTQVSLKEFKNTDMKGKVIVAIALPFLPENVFVNSFKITPRSQNAHAYVNAGFAIPVDRETMTVSSQPRMVYGGITYNFLHAENTEKFLVGKKLTDPNTLTEALEILDKEVVPEPKFIAHNGSTVAYHKDLALTLFYKAYIGALGDHAPDRLKSAARSILQERAVSSGIQNYESKPDRYPISNPMTKIAAKLQAAGEAQYVNDIPSSEGEVYGAFVISTKGNCKLDKVDPSEALAIPGVISYFDANDIPKDGVNEIKFFNLPGPSEGVFCKGEVLYVGHVIGMVVADTQKLADHAAKVVKVTYKDCKPLILTFEQAIEAKSYSPPLTPPWSFLMSDINVGDAEESMKSAKHVITGKVECGAQHHFHMETQVCLSEPKEDGITVYSATQGISFVQKGISEFLAVKATSVDVIVQRLGGAFGGKGLRSLQVACACALAAKILDRPVKMKVNFNTMMANQGGRSPHMAKYKVAVNDKGILQGVEMDYYVDTGCTGEDNDLLATTGHIDNLYYCPNWKVNFHTLLTSKASTTFCRAPGCVQGVFIMESIMEHVAKALNKTPEEIREKNLYEEGQKTPSGHPIPYCSIRKLWKDITKTSEVKKRQKEITEFNKANRWRKRGLVLVPGKFNIEASFTQYTVFVSIFSADGTVAIQHGGVEMGQGINVKVAQAAAYVLGVPMEMIIVKPNHTVFSPNSSPTGGSVGSETCVKGVMECCKMLNERIKPVREANPGVPWKQLIMMCGFQKVDLSAKYHARGAPKEEDYVAYGVTCTEAEVDILTGERLILRSDILFDCGESLNPEVDVGQVEGAFIFGMGYWMSEKVYYDEETGEELSTGTWTYKPPTTKDIPVDLRVTFLKDAPNPLGVLGSKASGEPPSTMSCACLFAIKRAVEEARKESGNDVYFTLNGPATVEMTQQSALIQREQLSLDPGVKKGQCFLSKK